MTFFIVLAFFNGAVISSSRTLNGQMSSQIGPLHASFWNHGVGFAFLTAVLCLTGQWNTLGLLAAPRSSYLGGVFGALFVAVSSFAFPRLGATHAALLVISGQMCTAMLIDWDKKGTGPTLIQCLGVILVLFGVYLTRILKPTSEGEPDEA